MHTKIGIKLTKERKMGLGDITIFAGNEFLLHITSKPRSLNIIAKVERGSVYEGGFFLYRGNIFICKMCWVDDSAGSIDNVEAKRFLPAIPTDYVSGTIVEEVKKEEKKET